MKILIADDETKIREGLCSYVISKGYRADDVRSAKDGSEALKIADQFKPDILITDVIMPGIDGINLAKQLVKRFEDLKIIMISGYNEIGYLKSAFKFNAVDYILKPININELNEVLIKVTSILDKENREKQEKELLRRKVEESLPFLRKQFFLSLLAGDYYNLAYLAERAAFLDVNLASNKRYIIIAIRLDAGIKDNHIDYYLSTDHYHEEMFSITVTSRIRTCFSISEEWSVLKKDIHEYICLYHYEESVNRDFLKRTLAIASEEFQTCLHSDFGISASIGFGNPVNNLIETPKSYSQAIEAVNQRFMLGKGIVVFYSDIQDETKSILFITKGIERELVESLYEADANYISNAVQKLFDSIFFSNEISWIKGSDIQNLRLQLIATLLNVLKEANVISDNQFLATFLQWNELLAIESIHELKMWMVLKLESISKYIKNSCKSKSDKVIGRARHIIDERFAEPISIQSVADEIGITPNYMSTLFKTETGVNFVEYLTKLRLNKALELMRNSDMKLHLIAEAVGYTDANYFAKIFKKHFGLNPSEYMG